MIDNDGKYYLSVGESQEDCSTCKYSKVFIREWTNGKTFTDRRCMIAFSKYDECKYEKRDKNE